MIVALVLLSALCCALLARMVYDPPDTRRANAERVRAIEVGTYERVLAECREAAEYWQETARAVMVEARQMRVDAQTVLDRAYQLHVDLVRDRENTNRAIVALSQGPGGRNLALMDQAALRFEQTDHATSGHVNFDEFLDREERRIVTGDEESMSRPAGL